MVELVPATREILESHYGDSLGRTAYAIAAVDGDRVLGVAGFYVAPVSVVVFSEISDELRRMPKVILKGSRMILEMVRKKGLVAYAKCDKRIEAAQRFLEHLGFTRFNGEIFVWQPRSRS